MYHISLDENFAPFIVNGVTWLRQTNANPARGLADDPADAPNRRTALQKVAQLNLMLGFIANFCTVIARDTIIKKSTSISSVWQSIRQHYGFQKSGSHFLGFPLAPPRERIVVSRFAFRFVDSYTP